MDIKLFQCGSVNGKTYKNKLQNKSELEAEARHQQINIRDALFGGRTEGCKSHHECNAAEQIFYYDVVSLYPTVNALDDYAIGFAGYRKITPEDILNGSFFDIAKVDVEPPRDLYVCVIPGKSHGKLLFHVKPVKMRHTLQ